LVYTFFFAFFYAIALSNHDNFLFSFYYFGLYTKNTLDVSTFATRTMEYDVLKKIWTVSNAV
jgi:hypothetical protein